MCTESDQSTINRVSCFLNMNDSQNQNNFDFVPKSDYNEKLHLENKCLFHNQQFLEGEKCGIRKRCTINSLTCDHCSSFGEKLKSKTDGNLDEKSGDWKYDEKFIKDSIENIQEPTEWKWKNPYSISDFDRSKYCRHNFAENDFTTNLLRDLCDKDSRFKVPSKIDNNKNILYNFREYLVNYQASCGIPRTEYSFLALISMMGRATGRSLLALLYVMLNIIPVMEVFLYLLRFVLDKVISINNCKDFRQMMTQCVIFITELFSVYICLLFIFGFIILPIVHIVFDIVAKIMFYY